MRKFSIRGFSVSKDEVVNKEIGIHISAVSKILFSLATEDIDNMRMNNRIESTKDCR